jgi:hypothetical protein
MREITQTFTILEKRKEIERLNEQLRQQISFINDDIHSMELAILRAQFRKRQIMDQITANTNVFFELGKKLR